VWTWHFMAVCPEASVWFDGQNYMFTWSRIIGNKPSTLNYLWFFSTTWYTCYCPINVYAIRKEQKRMQKIGCYVKIMLFALKYEISILMYVIAVSLVKFNGYLNVVVSREKHFSALFTCIILLLIRIFFTWFWIVIEYYWY